MVKTPKIDGYIPSLWRIGAGLMIIGMLIKWSRVLPQLIGGTSVAGGVDLISRHREVTTWFAGGQVYGVISTADYPPASYAILWPFIGWLSEPRVRWLWAVTAIVGIAYLAHQFVSATDPRNGSERLFLCLIPFAAYPTDASLLVGQLITHILPLLTASILMMHRNRARWIDDLLIGGLFLVTLVKPQVSAPFFWFILIFPRRLRPAFLVVAGYLALTVLASMFQDAEFPDLIRSWLNQERVVYVHDGHTNLYLLLYSLGLQSIALGASIAALLAFGIWAWFHRRTDIWIYLGVAGLFSRLWIHHRIYDDLLLLLPMIALYRLARGRDSVFGGKAGVLFLLNWGLMMAPVAPFLYYPSLIWLSPAIKTVMAALWLTTLALLLIAARRHVYNERTQSA